MIYYVMDKRFVVLVFTLLLLFLIAIVSGGSEVHDVGFTGQRADDSTGLISFPYRTYDPDAGRFLQRDPSGYVDGENLYEYVGGNALGSVDELGLSAGQAGRLITRLEKLTDTHKIRAFEFADKMVSSKGVNLDELKSQWLLGLYLGDSHRQLATAIGNNAFELRELQIVFSSDVVKSHGADYNWYDAEVYRQQPTISIGRSTDISVNLFNLDWALGRMVSLWLDIEFWHVLGGSNAQSSDPVKRFRVLIDEGLFAAKGDVKRQNYLLRSLRDHPGLRIIRGEAKSRGTPLTRVQAYEVARYLHDAAGKEPLIEGKRYLSPGRIPPQIKAYLDPELGTSEYVPSDFLLENFGKALYQVRNRKKPVVIPVERTLVPGSPSLSKDIKINNLLLNLE
jgi:RHS repeat-associated protein